MAASTKKATAVKAEAVKAETTTEPKAEKAEAETTTEPTTTEEPKETTEPKEAEKADDGADGPEAFSEEAKADDDDGSEEETTEPKAETKATAKKATAEEAEEAKAIPTAPPFDGMNGTEEPEEAEETEAVRLRLKAEAEEADANVTNAVVAFGYRLARIVNFGRFGTKAEAFAWIAETIGLSRSRASQTVQAYRVAVETPLVTEMVQTVDGLVFLDRFSSEDRTAIVVNAKEDIGNRRSIPVPVLQDHAEIVSDEYHAEREAEREAEAKKAKATAEREAKKAEAKAKGKKAEAEKAEADAKKAKAEADGTSDDDGSDDGAEADGAAIKGSGDNSAQLEKERQEAYEALTARNTSIVLAEAVEALAEGKDPAEVVSRVFGFGLLLGGGHGPQTVLAWNRLQTENPLGAYVAERASAEKAEREAKAKEATAKKEAVPAVV